MDVVFVCGEQGFEDFLVGFECFSHQCVEIMDEGRCPVFVAGNVVFEYIVGFFVVKVLSEELEKPLLRKRTLGIFK